MLILKSLLAALLLVLPLSAQAAIVTAYDDASDPVYTPGPYHGLNGGFGFNPWQHTPPSPNFLIYVGTSTTNPPGGGHAMFLNAIEATAIPEPASTLTLIPLAAALVLQRRRNKATMYLP
jgi:hypothetical protein